MQFLEDDLRKTQIFFLEYQITYKMKEVPLEYFAKPMRDEQLVP